MDRDGEQIDAVSDECDQSVPLRLITDISGNGTQAVAEELAQARDDTDGGGAGSERPEERAVDARAALVGHVGKEVDDAHRQHEPKSMRGGACPFCIALHGVAFSLHGRTLPAGDPCVN